jgi:hypothetical protein
MASGRLIPQEHSVDMAAYGYAATVDYLAFKGPNQEIHLLAGTGAPTGVNLNAPTGSIYIDTAAGEIYTKTDATTWANQT